MTTFLEIAELENGDIVLRESHDDADPECDDNAPGLLPLQGADSAGRPGRSHQESTAFELADVKLSGRTVRREPLVRIRFSHEVRDLLGNDLVGVAEAMIDAATDYLDGENAGIEADPAPAAPVIH